MKHGPSQQSTDDRASPSLYFDLLADFFNRISQLRREMTHTGLEDLRSPFECLS
jgi:hypothetical protein